MSQPVEGSVGHIRLSNRVADRITHDILSRNMPPGALIGMEQDLMQQHGISRATLREAVRQMEARGVARMRRGAGGGLLATGTCVSIAAGTLATYFEFSAVTLAELVRARAELEAMAAGMAATRVDDGHIAELRAAVASWEGVIDPIVARKLHFTLWEMIARMSGSPILELATSAFLRVTVDISPLLTGSQDVVRRYLDEQLQQKARLVEAIAAGDTAGATAMVRTEGEGLLNAPTFAPYLDLALPDLVLESGQMPAVQRPADDKLGITTALRLRRDIVSEGWPPGKMIGTEQQLRERYRVSRGLLREALMLLEVNGVVQFQRGRVGGIVVGRPDPAATIAATSRHMRFMELADADLRNIVATIDTFAIGASIEAKGDLPLPELFDESGAPPDYQVMLTAIYPPPEKRSAELICDIVRAYKPTVGYPHPTQKEQAIHWPALREAVRLRDPSLAQRHLRGLWGKLDQAG